jgi:hypothetical protein
MSRQLVARRPSLSHYLAPVPVPPDRIVPSQERLSPEHPWYSEIVDIHRRAVEAGMARYPDPATGLWVFTASFLWERGYCCETGCRHCPYVER